MEGGTWRLIEPTPVQISAYAVTFYAGHHYYFGGSSGSQIIKSIFALEEKTWTWSKLGKMKSRRFGHGVILVEEKFVVIGGFEEMKNEACVLKKGEFSCKEFTTSLNDYAFWPILYLLDENQKSC